MNRLRQSACANLLCLAGLTATVLACGVPPGPPPPPPDPPIVCCRIVSWFVDPICPDMECVIICYFREDGLPLYQSNPMPLFPNQQCACGVGALPPLPGLVDGGLSFGAPGQDPDCIPMPPNAPGYGPFTVECDPQTQFQVDSFFDVFYKVAGVPSGSGRCGPATAYTFGGPGNIPPGVIFNVYRKICFPRGFNPSNLCGPAGLTGIGLFLVENGQVFAEPPALGLPPVPFSQFVQNPGASAFYKVKCLPLTLPAPCPLPAPPPCFGDANGDGVVNFSDITAVLSVFGLVCP